MKKIIMVLMLSFGSLFAGGFVGGEVATGKAHGSSDARVNSGIIKIGSDNEGAKLFIYGGMDHYNAGEGSTKSYGVEFDKKFNDFFVGAGMGFGKKNIKGCEASVHDRVLKVGHVWVEESSNVEAGLKYTDRLYKNDDTRDRLMLVFVGYNFNL